MMAHGEQSAKERMLKAAIDQINDLKKKEEVTTKDIVGVFGNFLELFGPMIVQDYVTVGEVIERITSHREACPALQRHMTVGGQQGSLSFKGVKWQGPITVLGIAVLIFVAYVLHGFGIANF